MSINTTRGMSFDPEQARIDRLRREADKARAAKNADRQKADEVRSCYREHSPAQIRKAGQMIHTCSKVIKITTAEDFLRERHAEGYHVPALANPRYVRVEIEGSFEKASHIMTSNRAVGL
jgi:hypothetical protein